MNPSNNSSGFLFQSGGGLQSGGAPQDSASGGIQNNGSPLFSGSSGTGQQDILGQASVVGPVNFNASTGQQGGQAVPPEPNSGVLGFSEPILLLIVLVVALAMAYMLEKIVKLKD